LFLCWWWGTRALPEGSIPADPSRGFYSQASLDKRNTFLKLFDRPFVPGCVL
jgi:hypothetical protein